MARQVLIVDDNAVFAQRLARCLEARGVAVTLCAHGARVPEALREAAPDVAVVEAVLPGLSGVRLLDYLRSHTPATGVLMVAARGNVETAVEAMKRGAIDYLVKPLSPEVVADRIVDLLPATDPAGGIGEAGADGTALIGECPALRSLLALIDRVAAVDSPVLLSGESGTGKELVARAVHQRSGRAGAPFVAVNCSALAEGMLDSELFGHVAGAFTDAHEARPGLFEQATGGVVFLDELASTLPSFQVRLLRVLEDGEVRPVGGTSSLQTDVRIIAASNLDLASAVAAGSFREDLFYRLNVVHIRMPPLRERAGDVALLAHHFLRLACGTGEPAGLAPNVLQRLEAYPWPGNVRELRNVIERAVMLAAGDRIAVEHLPDELRAPRPELIEPYATAKARAVARFQEDYLRRLLALSEGNVTRAAAAARVPRQTLHRLLRKSGRRRSVTSM